MLPLPSLGMCLGIRASPGVVGNGCEAAYLEWEGKDWDQGESGLWKVPATLGQDGEADTHGRLLRYYP